MYFSYFSNYLSTDSCFGLRDKSVKKCYLNYIAIISNVVGGHCTHEFPNDVSTPR